MPILTPRYLGPIPHPAIGVRMPEIFLKGILTAYKLTNTAGGLMLSCSREAAPQYVIEAPPGRYPITLGHTGVSVNEYILKSAELARTLEVVVEIEADHLIVGSPLQAVQRIMGETKQVELTEKEIFESMAFVKDAIDEAIGTGFVNSFTVDTTSLINLKVEKLSKEDIVAEFYAEFPEGVNLIKEYSKELYFSWLDGRLYRISFDEEEIMRMALKFKRSLEVAFEVYSYIREKMGEMPFGFELALDELPRLTGKELAFYLHEWRKLGGHADFVAPNIGFKKREDFEGNLQGLEERLSFLAAISNGYGAMLSIHSGSGKTPYTGKGEGVYEAILRATGGRIKYKVSGVYFELLMELLANSSVERRRKLFERIFDDVRSFVEEQIRLASPFFSNATRDMFNAYMEAVRAGKAVERDSRSDFFRHHSFIALSLRDEKGRRYLKEELFKLYSSDESFRDLVDREVAELTLRLINGLRFSNNLAHFRR